MCENVWKWDFQNDIVGVAISEEPDVDEDGRIGEDCSYGIIG